MVKATAGNKLLVILVDLALLLLAQESKSIEAFTCNTSRQRRRHRQQQHQFAFSKRHRTSYLSVLYSAKAESSKDNDDLSDSTSTAETSAPIPKSDSASYFLQTSGFSRKLSSDDDQTTKESVRLSEENKRRSLEQQVSTSPTFKSIVQDNPDVLRDEWNMRRKAEESARKKNAKALADRQKEYWLDRMKKNLGKRGNLGTWKEGLETATSATTSKETVESTTQVEHQSSPSSAEPPKSPPADDSEQQQSQSAEPLPKQEQQSTIAEIGTTQEKTIGEVVDEGNIAAEDELLAAEAAQANVSVKGESEATTDFDKSSEIIEDAEEKDRAVSADEEVEENTEKVEQAIEEEESSVQANEELEAAEAKSQTSEEVTMKDNVDELQPVATKEAAVVGVDSASTGGATEVEQKATEDAHVEGETEETEDQEIATAEAKSSTSEEVTMKDEFEELQPATTNDSVSTGEMAATEVEHKATKDAPVEGKTEEIEDQEVATTETKSPTSEEVITKGEVEELQSATTNDSVSTGEAAATEVEHKATKDAPVEGKTEEIEDQEVATGDTLEADEEDSTVTNEEMNDEEAEAKETEEARLIREEAEEEILAQQFSSRIGNALEVVEEVSTVTSETAAAVTNVKATPTEQEETVSHETEVGAMDAEAKAENEEVTQLAAETKSKAEAKVEKQEEAKGGESTVLEEAKQLEEKEEASLNLKQLEEKSTGIVFEPKLGPGRYLIGVGVRRNAFINIYAVGMYSDAIVKASLSSLSRTKDENLALQTLQSTSKTVPTTFVLQMAFKAGAETIANAIADNVSTRHNTNTNSNSQEEKAKEDEIHLLKELILNGIKTCTKDGEAIKGTILQFDCDAENGFLSVSVNGKTQGTVPSLELCKSFCEMYLDDKCVSKTLKESCLDNCCSS